MSYPCVNKSIAVLILGLSFINIDLNLDLDPGAQKGFFSVRLLKAAASPLEPADSSENQNNSTDPLWAEAKIVPADLKPGQSGELQISLKLPAGYHAYEDQFKIEINQPEGITQGKLQISPLKNWFDKFSNKQKTGVEGESKIIVPIELHPQLQSKENKINLTLTYQACGETFCLFPTQKKISAAWLNENFQSSHFSREAILTTSGFQNTLSESIWLAFLFAFLAGLLTSFTPCIFPMIPITLAILGHDSEKRSRAQNFLTALVYVHGIALTYSFLGLAAVKSGHVFGSTLGNPWIVGALCFLMLLMSLSLLGLFDLQVPSVIRNKFGRGHSRTDYFGALLSGLIAGLVASPCVGPVLVSILAFVSTQGSYTLGFFLLFTYAMGLGMIFLALGAFSELTKKLPRSGPWLEGVKILLSSFMLVGFFYYLQFLLSDRLWLGVLGFGLVLYSSFLGAFGQVKPNTAWRRIKKGILLSAFTLGVGFLVSSSLNLNTGTPLMSMDFPDSQKLNWQMFSEEKLEAAKANRQPVIIDFWAEWCAACHELEQLTFTDPRVKEFSGKFVLLKFDATRDSETLKKLKKKYSIQGLPTLLFFNPNGVWIESLTLTEFEKPEPFYKRMQKATRL